MSDLISRQDAINSIESHIRTGDELYPITETDKILNHAFEISASCIYNMPSAEPKQKTGKWIKLDMHIGMADHKCTACNGECYVPTIMGEPIYAFCPNCGARMEVEE